MSEDAEGVPSPTEIIDMMRARIKFMRENSRWLQLRNFARYEEFLLTLESADFFLERFETEQALIEVEKARVLVNMK